MIEENPSRAEVEPIRWPRPPSNGWICTGERLPEIGQLFFGVCCDSGMRYCPGGAHLFRRVPVPEGDQWWKNPWATVCLSSGGRPVSCPDWWTPANVEGMPRNGEDEQR